jgi:hypothetical protein
LSLSSTQSRVQYIEMQLHSLPPPQLSITPGC